MWKWSEAQACLLLAVSYSACTTEPGSGGGAGGAAGGTGGVGSPMAGSAGQSFEACAPFTASAPDASAPLRLGLNDASPFGSRSGRVTAIAPDRMELQTTDGTWMLGWRGPSLAPAFAVDDDVQITARVLSGIVGHSITIVRSDTATAAMVQGGSWKVLSKAPGATETFSDLGPDFPELVYELVSCCSRPLGQRFIDCDYSALDATFAGETTAIAGGATGAAGPWSVTNVKSRYVESGEYVWDLEVTLLGPATPRTADGGI